MSRLPVSAVLLAALCCAEQAWAQSAFVQGGIVIDARRFSGQPGDRVFDANAIGVLAGGGGFITSILSAGVELDMGRESEVAQSSSVTVSGRPETITTTFVSARRSVSALFGIHSPSTHRVRAGAY